MTFIKLTDDISVNPDHVETMEWDRRSYVNAPGTSTLVITLFTGRQIRIEHNPPTVDAYALEKQILSRDPGPV